MLLIGSPHRGGPNSLRGVCVCLRRSFVLLLLRTRIAIPGWSSRQSKSSGVFRRSRGLRRMGNKQAAPEVKATESSPLVSTEEKAKNGTCLVAARGDLSCISRRASPGHREGDSDHGGEYVDRVERNRVEY